jgi:hypothetical protein
MSANEEKCPGACRPNKHRERNITMHVITPEPLPETVHMPCYACEENPASHVCRYKVGELAVQVCLCPECMKLDTKRLLSGTVGIQGLADLPSNNFSAASMTTL